MIASTCGVEIRFAEGLNYAHRGKTLELKLNRST